MLVLPMLARRTARIVSSVSLVLVTGCGDSTAPRENPVPAITAISPTEVDQGSEDATLTVTGTDFVESSVVQLDGDDQPTEFVSKSKLSATLSASDLSTAGDAQVVVVNPAPGGGKSNAVVLTVEVGTNPAPVITSLSPDHVIAGSGPATVTLEGTGFLPQSRVFLGEAEKEVRYLSPTRLEIDLGESEVAAGGTFPIRVTNPAPGGGTSSPASFELRNPKPEIVSLGSTETTAGLPSYTLIVNGTGFVANSQVRFDGSARPTTLVSDGVLEATLSEDDLRVAGEFAISVTNPGPGGGDSSPVSFHVLNGVPAITLLPSRGASAGGTGFELMVHGRYFVNGAVIRWNGTDLPTRYINGRRLAATFSAADVASAGTAEITVYNPPPGGGVSTPADFTVRTVPAATVTSSEVIPMEAGDLIYDPKSARLYLSAKGSDPNANSIVQVDPNSGSITGSVFVGSGPDLLARSDDGQYLYVGLNGAGAVRQVRLATLTPGTQWSLPSGQVAGDIEVIPGHPEAVAVSRHSPGLSPPLEGVTIYDDGVARPNSSPGHTGGARIEFLEADSLLYGFNNASTGFQFFTIAVEPAGARHLSEATGLISGFYTDIVGTAGRIYGTDGSVVDAEQETRLGSFGTSASALAADPETGRVFMVTDQGIEVYDMNTYKLLGTITIAGYDFGHPALADPRLVLWGTDGIAFLDEDSLYLVRSPIVAP